MNYSSGRLLLSNEREREVSRFHAWTMVLVPLAAILFQVYVPLFVPFLSLVELPLLVVVYFALMRRSQMAGLLIGALVGLAQDSLSKNPLGMYGIVKTLVGYFASSIGVRLDVDNFAMRALLTFFFSVFHQAFYWILTRALLAQQSPFEIQRALVLGLLNAVVAIVLFHLLDKLRDSA